MQDLLLQREASLAAMSLGAGLTNVRKYNFAQTGYFYSGMYSFCMGLERVLKLVAIYDHRLTSADQFPSNAVLKSFGHALSDLLNHATAIVASRSISIDQVYADDAIYAKIIPWLSDFAQTTRYYNLDTLTGRSHRSDEPLVRWDKEVASELVTRHHRPSAARIQEREIMKAMLGGIAHVQHTTATGAEIDDVSSFVDEGATVLVKQKYSAYYLYQLSRFSCDVLAELEYAGNFYPYLREFFPLFRSDERNWVLNRKIWDPNKL